MQQTSRTQVSGDSPFKGRVYEDKSVRRIIDKVIRQ